MLRPLAFIISLYELTFHINLDNLFLSRANVNLELIVACLS